MSPDASCLCAHGVRLASLSTRPALRASASPDPAVVAVVDGKTVTLPLLDALAVPVIDVPLIVSNMGQEPDLAPAAMVYNLSASAFEAFAQKTMGAFGPDFAARLLKYYQAEMAVSPQKAYDSISADIEMTCGNIDVAAAASAGFKSPVYSLVVQAPPSHPVNMTMVGPYAPRYAFHVWDMIAASQLFSLPMMGMNYMAHPYDLKLGATISNAWKSLTTSGTLAGTGWHAMDPDGSAYNTVVISATGSGSAMSVEVANEPSYKADVCMWYRTRGLGSPTFWWSD